MAKKKSKKRIVILVVVLVIVALLVLGYVQMRQRALENAKTAYNIASVQKGTIQVKVKGEGSVQPLNDDSVYSSVAGTVDTVSAENGDTVKAGDIIASFKSDDLESQRDSLKSQISDADAEIATLRSMDGSDYIKSPADGTVKAVYAKKGDSVDAVMDKYGSLAVVSPDNIMKVVVPYADGIVQGQKVTVKSGTISITGTVTKVDTVKNEVTVEFKYSKLKAGDKASVTGDGGASLGESSIEVANPVYITGRGGTISKVYKSVGNSIDRGSDMFHLDGDILSSQLYADIDNRASLQDQLDTVESNLDSLVVKAGTDGVISDLSLSKDQTVQAGEKLFTVQSNSRVKIDVDIDELDIANITLGQQATVTFDALPDKVFTAKVQKINPVGTSENNVTHFTVTLELDNAQGVMLGMSADVEIISQQVDNALYIPVEGIQVINGEKYVVLAKDINKKLQSTPATHKVTTGVTDGVNIQITSGLSEGDQVAVPQVSDSSNTTGMFRMGGGTTTTKTSGSPSGPAASVK